MGFGAVQSVDRPVIQDFAVLGAVVRFATDCSAFDNIGGSFFPRASARRRMPLQAFALKKYRCGTVPTSKTSDNEHTAASLGHSEILSVKHSVGEPIPELNQRPEEGTKVPSASA
jgi:hypothetical protein